jgi:hypothetical protein
MGDVLSGGVTKGFRAMRERAEQTLKFGTPEMPVSSMVPDTVKGANEAGGTDPYGSFSSSTSSRAMIWHTNPRGTATPQPWAKGQMGTVRGSDTGSSLIGVQAEGRY